MNIENSVVQVITEHTPRDWTAPWNYLGYYHSTGSGFYINFRKKKYILTNAHCVSNASYVKVRKRGGGTYAAQVDWIIYECDLALLKVSEGKSFWADMVPLVLGEMPNKLDKVYVYGFPLGGLNVSITKGVVSRIQIVPYFNHVRGIALQVDAAINFGNSGGPVTNKAGEVVGVAFSGEPDDFTQNMGYIIPPEIIYFFLKGYKNFNGLCHLKASTQFLNPSLKSWYKFSGQGVLVNQSHGQLKEGDIIMSLDGKSIDDAGTMKLSDVLNSTREIAQHEMVNFANYTALRHQGEKIDVGLWRGGKEVHEELTLQNYQPEIPIMESHNILDYFILMGMVFLPLSLSLMEAKRQDRQYVCHLTALIEQRGKGAVILSEFVNSDHTTPLPRNNLILKSVNGKKIRSIPELVEICKEPPLMFTFKDTSVVLALTDLSADARILKEYFGKVPSFSISREKA